MNLHISLPKNRFVAAEDILLNVALTNDGPAPVQVPDPFHSASAQPVYTVVGPAFPQGYTFSFRSAASDDKGLAPSDDDLEFVTIEPGETLEEDVPLHEWVPFDMPGAYFIVAELRWQGVADTSEPVAFTLEPLQIRALATAVDTGLADASDVQVAFLHGNDGETYLYEALFVEDRFERGMFERWSVEGVGLALDALDVLMPWANYDRKTALYNWHAWRTDTALYARFLLEEEVQHLDLLTPIDTLVRPALMTRSGALDLFALLEGGREIVRARFFPPDDEGVAAPPRVLWRTPLPAPANGARCSLTPPASHREGHPVLVFTAQGEEALLVFSLRTTEDAGPGPIRTVRLPDAFVMSGSQPALHVASDGTVRAAFLFGNDPAVSDLALACITYDAEGTPVAPPEVTALDPLPAPPRAAAAAFQSGSDNAPHPEWVVLLDTEDRLPAMISSRFPERVRPLDAPPALPLELLPRARATYLLVVDPASGPALVSLR